MRQGDKVVMEEALQIVPLPATIVILAVAGQALGQALFRAVEVVESPLQLTLGDTAEVEGTARLPAMGRLIAMRFFRFFTLDDGVIAGGTSIMPKPGDGRVSRHGCQQSNGRQACGQGPAPSPFPDDFVNLDRPRLDR